MYTISPVTIDKWNYWYIYGVMSWSRNPDVYTEYTSTMDWLARKVNHVSM